MHVGPASGAFGGAPLWGHEAREVCAEADGDDADDDDDDHEGDGDDDSDDDDNSDSDDDDGDGDADDDDGDGDSDMRRRRRRKEEPRGAVSSKRGPNAAGGRRGNQKLSDEGTARRRPRDPLRGIGVKSSSRQPRAAALAGQVGAALRVLLVLTSFRGQRPR